MSAMVIPKCQQWLYRNASNGYTKIPAMVIPKCQQWLYRNASNGYTKMPAMVIPKCQQTLYRNASKLYTEMPATVIRKCQQRLFRNASNVMTIFFLRIFDPDGTIRGDNSTLQVQLFSQRNQPQQEGWGHRLIIDT